MVFDVQAWWQILSDSQYLYNPSICSWQEMAGRSIYQVKSRDNVAKEV